MCGRVTQFSRHEEVLRDLGVAVPAVAPRYNISPGTPLLCVRREQGAWKAEPLAWGFVPAWAAPDAREEGHANARAEDIFDRPTFRDAARLRRCVVPIDGYYEWKTEGRQKIPYYFRAADGGPLAVGGLWSLQVRPDGTMRRTLCLVTVAPNREAGEVHGRMPVLLTGPRRAAWLAERPLAPAEFATLAATAPDRSLALHRVSSDVNRVACDDPRLIEPVTGATDQPDFLGDLLG
jgi:putative SOS response-associated peptidase YedK